MPLPSNAQDGALLAQAKALDAWEVTAVSLLHRRQVLFYSIFWILNFKFSLEKIVFLKEMLEDQYVAQLRFARYSSLPIGNIVGDFLRTVPKDLLICKF